MLAAMQKYFYESMKWISAHHYVQLLLGLLAVFFIAWLVHLILRRFLVRGIDRLVRHSSTSWDDALQESRVFERIALVVPVLVIWQGSALIPEIPDRLLDLLQRLAVSSIVLIAMLSINGVLSSLNMIAAAKRDKESSIKGYLEIGQLVVLLIAGVLILGVLLNRSPMVLLGGLGAMTAVLLLVFRDTLLGFVASLQIASNDMVRVGDWIEMPSAGADGDVVDIALHTMKVQNFDKTVVTIPTYKLIEESFKNWRGMTEAGGRRIKRALWFDINTVRFLSPEEEIFFGSKALLHGYMEEKQQAIKTHNSQQDGAAGVVADMRRLTNIGTLRAYTESYLRNHPGIHLDMTLMVRQLQSSAEGLPLEIYCFTKTTDWAEYEGVQADVFDHILSMTQEFGLRIFQNESDHATASASNSAAKPANLESPANSENAENP